MTEACPAQLRFRTAKAEYERWVEETKRHIVDGDVFQTVISQRLDLDSPADPFDVYRVLRTLNPQSVHVFHDAHRRRRTRFQRDRFQPPRR